MATTHVYEYCAHLGRVWTQFETNFNSFYVSAAVTALNITLDTSSGWRDLQLDSVQGVNNVVTHLIDTAMPASNKYTADYLQGLPGWMTMVRVVAPTSGVKTFAPLFTSHVVATRALIWANYTNAVIQASGSFTWTVNPIGSTGYNAYRVWTDNDMSGMDWTTAVAQVQSTAGRWALSANPAEMGRAPSIPVVGGGGATDLSALVEAVQDLAHQEIQTTINNGETSVLGYGGDILTP